MSDHGFGVANDAFGNVYFAGSFDGTATFGAGTANETTLAGNRNGAYLARYTSGGALQWVVRSVVHANGAARAYDAATDETGNAYMTGFFRGEVTFGAGEPNETALATTGLSHGFIGKYDPEGRLLWAVDVSSAASSAFQSNSVAVAPGGFVYVTGAYTDVSSLAGPERDVFVAKYGPDGTLLWMHTLGQQDDGRISDGTHVATDAAGHAYVAGDCSGLLTMEGDTEGLACNGTFILKYTPDGVLVWARSAPGTAYGLAADAAGTFYTTGSFVGSVIFGAGDANETTLVSSGYRDAYLARYAADGTLSWVRHAGGTYNTFSAEGRGVAIAPGGNVYTTGTYWNDIVFGAGGGNETQLTTSGQSEIFVGKYNAEGHFLWATSAGGAGVDASEDITIDAAGRLFMTGRFEETAFFGEEFETKLDSAGSWDIFMARVVGSPLEGVRSNRAPSLAWVNQTTSADYGGSESRDLAVDAAGHTVVTGDYDGEVDFGSDVTPPAGTGSYVARYDAQGGLLWVEAAESPYAESYGVAVDAEGNSTVTGQYSESITFGRGSPQETTLEGSYRLFVARYGPDGALIWARGSATDGAAYGNAKGHAVDVDAAGNGYVTGIFEGTVVFGPGEAGETILTSNGDVDLFLARYRPDGTLDWVTRAASNTHVSGYGVAVDDAGRIFVTGSCFTEATFGPGEPNEAHLEASMFVARYEPDGTLDWVRRAIAGDGGMEGLDIDLDAAGNAYVTGSFDETATFGDGEANETTLTNDLYEELFVAKYTPDGDLAWAKQAHGIGATRGTDIAVDPSGNSLITGWFAGAVILGRDEANEAALVSAGAEDVLVAKYDPDGALVWGRREGGEGRDQGTGLGLDAAHHVYVTGRIEQESVFGLAEPSEATLVPTGNAELFLAKFAGDPTATPDTEPIETAADETGAGDGDRPDRFTLGQNYPNPFNPTTTIGFRLGEQAGSVRLEVYDVTGRRVRTLVAGPLPAGAHEVVWDGRDDAGRLLSSGVYAYRLEAGPHTFTRTMALVK